MFVYKPPPQRLYNPRLFTIVNLKVRPMAEQKQEQIPQYINKDMTVGDVVQKYPEVGPILTDYGLHCVGCHVATWETLEQGTLGHGMPSEVLNAMIDDANKFIHSQQNKPDEHHEESHEGSMEITSAAAKKFRDLMVTEGKADHALRVQVVPGGCSGFQYEFSFDEKSSDNDKVMEKDGLKIFIDQESLSHMNGASIDFVDSLQETGFKINNPTAKSGCGCGKSFG